MTVAGQAYEHLADWFEYLNDDCDYAGWSQYFILGLRAMGAGRRGIELGAGSGAFTRALTRAGYQMTGVDISPAMLNRAVRLARDEGVSAQFILGDARTFSLKERADFVLAPNDCYNYIRQEELPRAFAHAAACLKKEGIFWFDVSSEYKFREKIANNMFADDRDDVTYLCFNELAGDSVKMSVTLFVRRGDGTFDRFDETHTQYIHREADIVSALRGAGFSVERVEGKCGEDKKESERLNFICRKI